MTDTAPPALTLPKTGVCTCVKHHTPTILFTEWHHVLPLSWGGPDEPANMIEVCSTTHYTIHFILNAFVRAGTQVSRVAQSHPVWPRYAYDLAVRAWTERDPTKPTPFWLPEPTAPMAFGGA